MRKWCFDGLDILIALADRVSCLEAARELWITEVLQYLNCNLEIVSFLLAWRIYLALDELGDDSFGGDLCGILR